MELTAAQQKVLNEGVQKMISAQSCRTSYEYFKKHMTGWRESETALQIADRVFQDAQENIVDVYRAKHETLLKLEKLGYIEIVNIEYNKFRLVKW